MLGKVNSSIKKTIRLVLIVSILTIILLATPLLAIIERYGPTEWWTSSSKPFSPNAGRAFNRIWSDADRYPNAPVYIEAHMEDFWFSSARITYIRNMRNQGHYFTADIAHPNDFDTTVSVEGYWTDLPSVHYDWDDDPFPFGNGYADESEVTVQDPNQLIAGRNYDFVTIFRDMTRGNTSGNLEVNSQRSYWSWFFQEYNVYDGQYEPLATPDYNTHGLLANIKGIAFALSSILEDKGFIEKQALVDEFTIKYTSPNQSYLIRSILNKRGC